MKKLLILLLALTSLLCFSCSEENDDDDNTAFLIAQANMIALTSPSTKYSVGDVVLKDGTVIKYDVNRIFTDAEKADAIAVIFYSGSAYDALGKCVLGIGLKKSNTKLLWCASDASAAKKKISTIECQIIDVVTDGAEKQFNFMGDLNGIDNLEQISAYLKSNNLTDDTNDKTKYPAFYYAKNYKDDFTKIKGTSFEDGWYLPTIAELYQYSKSTAKVYSSFTKLNTEKLNSQWSDWLTSSSQSTLKAEYYVAQRVSDSWCSPKGKKTDYKNAVYACAVRRFE